MSGVTRHTDEITNEWIQWQQLHDAISTTHEARTLAANTMRRLEAELLSQGVTLHEPEELYADKPTYAARKALHTRARDMQLARADNLAKHLDDNPDTPKSDMDHHILTAARDIASLNGLCDVLVRLGRVHAL